MFYFRPACLLVAAGAASVLVGTAVARPVPQMSIARHSVAIADVEHVTARAASDIHMLYRRATDEVAASLLYSAAAAVSAELAAQRQLLAQVSTPRAKRKEAEQKIPVLEAKLQEMKDKKRRHNMAHNHSNAPPAPDPNDSFDLAADAMLKSDLGRKRANKHLTGGK